MWIFDHQIDHITEIAVGMAFSAAAAPFFLVILKKTVDYTCIPNKG